MKAQGSMNSTVKGKIRNRTRPAALLLAAAALCAGCSSELASFDDTYTPASVEENYPIKVVQRPVQLRLAVQQGGLQADEMKQVTRFAREANAHASTPVTVAYPSRSALARSMAGQAAGLLVSNGVPRQYVLVTPADAPGNEITLAFARKVAETKPCGDWSKNLAGNQFNETAPNFGCAYQQNVAAMVTNPEDLQRPREATPSLSTAQGPALEKYYSGTWTNPTTDTGLSQ
jgi:pilus assembly protein CpaD